MFLNSVIGTREGGTLSCMSLAARAREMGCDMLFCSIVGILPEQKLCFEKNTFLLFPMSSLLLFLSSYFDSPSEDC